MEQNKADAVRIHAQNQVRDFTDKEKKFIKKHINIIQDRLSAIGCHLPIYDNIIFIKTTMAEEGNPMA